MKIERKYMAHFLNAALGSGTASYCRLGNDLEEYSPELSANVEKKNNILGQTSIIIDGDLVLDDLKTDIVEVKLWGEASANAYPAIKEECYIEIVSYGGDTTGYQIPFNVHYTGVKTKGTFNISTKTFTAA